MTARRRGQELTRSVPRLHVEEVDDGQLNGKPDTVEDVVFPVEGVEGNWVDVLVEEQSDVDHEEHDRQTLCSD